MDSYQIRYKFEHQMLPMKLLQDTVGFVEALKNEKKLLFRMVSAIFMEGDMENPYSEDQFDVSLLSTEDTATGIRLGFPPPEKAPLCYCGYLIFGHEFQNTSYFCVEKSMEEDSPFLCEWTYSGQHINYGRATREDEKDFRRCLEIYRSR